MAFSSWFIQFVESIKLFFIKLYESVFTNGYWKLYAEGFVNSLIMTVLALILGIIIGIIIAVIKYSYKTASESGSLEKAASPFAKVLNNLLKIANKVAELYTTVIRGTPVMVQMLIIYYMIFKQVHPDAKIFVAALAFGINSGAYVSEIIRGGIISVDAGQSETGHSLGLSNWDTMRLIVLPQAVRNILPALFNEIIAMVKETSIAGYISIVDITNAGDFVRSRTYSFEPLIVSAIIYLIIVIILTKIQKNLERRFSKGDRS